MGDADLNVDAITRGQGEPPVVKSPQRTNTASNYEAGKAQNITTSNSETHQVKLLVPSAEVTASTLVKAAPEPISSHSGSHDIGSLRPGPELFLLRCYSQMVFIIPQPLISPLIQVLKRKILVITLLLSEPPHSRLISNPLLLMFAMRVRCVDDGLNLSALPP